MTTLFFITKSTAFNGVGERSFTPESGSALTLHRGVPNPSTPPPHAVSKPQLRASLDIAIQTNNSWPASVMRCWQNATSSACADRAFRGVGGRSRSVRSGPAASGCLLLVLLMPRASSAALTVRYLHRRGEARPMSRSAIEGFALGRRFSLQRSKDPSLACSLH